MYDVGSFGWWPPNQEISPHFLRQIQSFPADSEAEICRQFSSNVSPNITTLINELGKEVGKHLDLSFKEKSVSEVLYIIRAGRNNAGSFRIDSGLEAFHILFKSCLCIYRLYILQLSFILCVHF